MIKQPLPWIVCVTSGKGGVGKTSLTVNLGLCLSRAGLRVLIVDGDLGLANVDLMLGLDVGRTVKDVLEGHADPEDALVWPDHGLAVLPATSGVPEMVTMGPEERERLGEYLGRIATGFDVVLMDTAAGIGSSVLWFNGFAHGSIVILTPDPTAVTDAYALIKVLMQRHGKESFHVVVNDTANDNEGRQVYDNIARVAETYLQVSLNYLGCVPSDPAVRQAVRQQRPFCATAPEGRAGRAVGAIGARIRGLVSDSTL